MIPFQVLFLLLVACLSCSRAKVYTEKQLDDMENQLMLRFQQRDKSNKGIMADLCKSAWLAAD